MQKLKNNEARPNFTGSFFFLKRVVHGQISLCSSRIVETLATYRKLDTTITHLQYLDLKIIFRFFSTVTAAATYKQQILVEHGQNKVSFGSRGSGYSFSINL